MASKVYAGGLFKVIKMQYRKKENSATGIASG